MNFDFAQLADWVAAFVFPLARMGGFVMTAPVFGARFVPAQVRIVLALALTFLLTTLVTPPAFDLFSARGMLAIIGETVIGAALGFVLTLIFDAVMLAAEFISLSIGLGFARLADPVRGSSTPVLGQLYLIVSMLLFLAVDGHLLVLCLLDGSFDTLPIGAFPAPAAFGELAALGVFLFAGALALALPALAAMLLTNLAYAVVSRAAPALNMFAVGFPLSLLFGLFLLLATIGLMPYALEQLTGDAVNAAGRFISGGDG